MQRLLLVGLLAACSEPETVDLNVQDARIERDQGDGGSDLDQGTGGEPAEVGVEAGLEGGMEGGLDPDVDGLEGGLADAGDVTLDAADEGTPGPPPPRDHIVVLSSRENAWIAWVSMDTLFAARLLENAEAVDAPVRIAAAPAFQGPLLGFRLTRPYVLLPDGEAGSLRAYDLTQPDADRDGMPDPPVDLQLWPPARVVVEDDEALVVGRTGPEPTAAVGWRLMSRSLGEIQVDSRGFGVPQAVVYALQGWVFGFDGDTCLDATNAAEPQGPWLCYGRPGARLLGDGSRVIWVGPTEAGLGAWLATPGAAVPADGEDPDGDQLVDALDNCPEVANPDQHDTDGNGIGDACQADDDADGVVDDVDSCPNAPNPVPEGQAGQLDTDQDGLGDVCDDDRDGDGVPNDRDNCPLRANPDQADGDGDRQGDACDNVVDNPAVCADAPNGPDLDGDGVIDFCDDDDDGDMTPDADDNCPRVRPTRRGEVNQADADSDGIGDLCDGDDRDADGVTDHYDTCPDQPNRLQVVGRSCAAPAPGRLTLVPDVLVEAWLATPSSGHLVAVRDLAGAASLWWLRWDRTHRIQADDPESVLGLSEIKTDLRAIGWSEAQNRPIPLPISLEAGPAPPTFRAPEGCANVATEACGARDADCDDEAQGLCCDNNLGRARTAVGGSDPIGRDWFAGLSDEGHLLLVRQGTALRQLSHPAGDDLGRVAEEVAVWEGVRRILWADNLATRTAILVERDVPDAMPGEGGMVPTEQRILWFQGVAGPADGPVPCPDPLGVSLLSAQMLTRVWCPAGGFDVTPDGMVVPLAWPGEGGALRWWEPNISGDAQLFLVARGDDHTLELWRQAPDGSLALADDPLPPEVATMTPEERTLPFRPALTPGGHTARVNGVRLETFQPGTGWRFVPGSGWSVDAKISRHDPVALSVGYARNPAGEDPGLLNLTYKLHSLRGDATSWGVPVETISGTGAEAYVGLGFGDYATGAFGRPILVAPTTRIQAGRTTTTFNFAGVGCVPPF